MRWDQHERCKHCGEGAPELYLALPLAQVEVLRCRLCRLAFASARYDDDEARALYDEILSSAGDYASFEPARSPRFRRLLDVALEGRVADGLAVLDVGAGGGGFLAHARERGAATVEGIEFSGTARAHARTAHGIVLSPDPLGAEGWTGRRFDLITIWDLLEHLPDPVGTLRRAVELLAPGGRIALTTPARQGPLHLAAIGAARATLGVVTVAARHRYNLLHLQIFRAADVAHLLEGLGLAVLSCERIADFSYPGSWYLRTAHVPRALSRPLGRLADAWLERLPPRNKLLAVAVRPAARARAGVPAAHV